MTSYPSRRTTRLRGYEYSQAGAYAITLCIEQRLPLLGRIVDGHVHLSPAGLMVATVWNQLDRYYPVSLDVSVVMPNHLHGILILGGNPGEDRDGATVPTPTLVLVGTIFLRDSILILFLVFCRQ